MLIRVLAVVTACLLLASTDETAAQERRAGRADLRYTAPMPAAVTYLSVDSMQMLNAGLPTGDMQINATMRSVVDLQISPADAGVHMKAMLREFNGNVETPMGSMPFPGAPASGTSTEFRVGLKGMDMKQSFEDAKKAGITGVDMNTLVSRTREMAPLLVLPGREVSLQQSWTDTIAHSDSIQGMHLNLRMIVRGTYVRDTVVEGRTLNVLAFRNEMKAQNSGQVEGRQIEQNMTSTSTERALWDSSQHLLVSLYATSEMAMDMVMPNMANIRITGTIRSLKQKM